MNIYAAKFGGHLFYDLFLQGPGGGGGGHGPLGPPGFATEHSLLTGPGKVLLWLSMRKIFSCTLDRKF